MSDVDRSYAERLVRSQQRRWKQLLDVQAPYRRLVRKLAVGRVLDVGCGIGRNLAHLGGRAVGVDVNAESVRIARGAGHRAFEPDQFLAVAPELGPFDTLLASHVVEHIGVAGAPAVLGTYVPFLRPAARLLLVTPQEAGFRSDPTHVEPMGFAELEHLATELGFLVTDRRSFPFPRPAGRVFRYNEFVVVADRDGGPA